MCSLRDVLPPSPDGDGIHYDAVIIPGGGIDDTTKLPHPWVCARLDAALKLSRKTDFFIVLSRGTTHRSPVLDADSFPITEAAASAKYLIQHGVCDRSRILLDTWSLDTIGNAYFARRMICEPMNLKRVCVITSAFHMPRARAIFDWVFHLDGWDAQVDVCKTENVSLSDAQSKARSSKEEASLSTLLQETIPRLDTMGKLAAYVMQQHGAYRAASVTEYDVGDAPPGVSAAKDRSQKDDIVSTY